MGRAIILECRPYDWRDEFPRVAEPSQELSKATMEKWRSLFS